MSFSTSGNDNDEMMNEINMTPLIDVMLVLLIVFMVTLPVIQHAVSIQLPRQTTQPIEPIPDPVAIDIAADGSLLWDKSGIDDDSLVLRLTEMAARPDKPALQLYADKAVRYERVAAVLAAAHRAGLAKINFVTEAEVSQ
jgi:biopolymer transport protein ExbD